MGERKWEEENGRREGGRKEVIRCRVVPFTITIRKLP